MKAGKTNPRYTALIASLKEASRANETGLWREIADRLESPSKNYAEVNLSKVSRYAQDGDVVLVPGKVLGSGSIESGISIAALSFSDAAVSKISAAKGTCMTIEDLIKSNPEGKNVRILR